MNEAVLAVADPESSMALGTWALVIIGVLSLVAGVPYALLTWQRGRDKRLVDSGRALEKKDTEKRDEIAERKKLLVDQNAMKDQFTKQTDTIMGAIKDLKTGQEQQGKRLDRIEATIKENGNGH